jgi:putative oxidoreductase
MEKVLGRFSPHAYALMRVVVGLLFACHGAQKVFGWFGGLDGKGTAALLSSLFGIAGTIELIMGLLIAVGLLAGYAAFIASGEMAAAYFMGHFPNGFWPIENKGEPAVLFCFVFFYVATQGAGIWSIDGARQRSSPT